MVLDVFVLSAPCQGHRICFLLGAMDRADLVFCGDWTNMECNFLVFNKKYAHVPDRGCVLEPL